MNKIVRLTFSKAGNNIQSLLCKSRINESRSDFIKDNYIPSTISSNNNIVTAPRYISSADELNINLWNQRRAERHFRDTNPLLFEELGVPEPINFEVTRSPMN